MRKCCVPGCTSGKNVCSHAFPADPLRCAKWIDSLQLNHFKSYTSKEIQINRVCYKHFRNNDYNQRSQRRMLLNTAVPVPSVVFNVMDLSINNIEQNRVQQQPQELQISENISQNAIVMDVVNNNHGFSLQTGTEMQEITNRSQVQKISRVKRLDPVCKRLYDMNMKLKRKNKYLHCMTQKMKKQKKDAGVTSTASTTLTTETVQDNFIQMILRNKDVHPQVSNHWIAVKVYSYFLKEK